MQDKELKPNSTINFSLKNSEAVVVAGKTDMLKSYFEHNIGILTGLTAYSLLDKRQILNSTKVLPNVAKAGIIAGSMVLSGLGTEQIMKYFE